MDRGTDARVADAEAPFEQRLRAAGAEQRGVHRGGDDPPDAEAAGEGRMNLTKQALRDASNAYALASTGTVTASVTLDALLKADWVVPVGLLGVYMVLLFPDGRL